MGFPRGSYKSDRVTWPYRSSSYDLGVPTSKPLGPAELLNQFLAFLDPLRPFEIEVVNVGEVAKVRTRYCWLGDLQNDAPI